MKKINEYAIIDIIGVVLISIVLIILIIPGIIRIIDKYELDNMKSEAKQIYMSVIEEYKEDSKTRKITSYCYKGDYGYAKTLDTGTVKSLRSLDDGKESYYISLDENGNVKVFAITLKDKAIILNKKIDVNTLDNLKIDDIIDIEDAKLTLDLCVY